MLKKTFIVAYLLRIYFIMNQRKIISIGIMVLSLGILVGANNDSLMTTLREKLVPKKTSSSLSKTSSPTPSIRVVSPTLTPKPTSTLRVQSKNSASHWFAWLSFSKILNIFSPQPKPTPSYTEHTLTLSDAERATSAGTFVEEFEQAMRMTPAPGPTSYSAPALITIDLGRVTPAPNIASSGATGIIVMRNPTGIIPSPSTKTMPTATPYPSVTPHPSVTPFPTQTPAPTPTPLLANGGVQNGDTTPPKIVINGGPASDVPTATTSACFPLWIEDDLSWYTAVDVRYRLDMSFWNPWSKNLEPCVYNLKPGTHLFGVVARDEAGNISSEVTRSFTVK